MNICVDIGNTNIKYGVFQKTQLIKVVKSVDPDSLIAALDKDDYDHCIISVVGNLSDTLKNRIPKSKKILFFDYQTPIPISLSYDTPETLGVDRLAAAIGAWYQFPGKPLLVVDIGTCITYDFISAQGVFEGGAISPGVELRYKALHNYTAHLPLIEGTSETALIGSDTKSAIQSGVINGLSEELEGMISRFLKKSPDLNVIITGGGAIFFESKIKAGIFVAPEILLVGLNRVLIYNAEEF